MSYRILPTKKFVKELKKLSKKYPSLKEEISRLAKTLHTNYEMGTPLGNNCFKIRMAIVSNAKGKVAAQG